MKYLNEPLNVIKSYYTPAKEEMKRISQVVNKVIEPFTEYDMVAQLNNTDNAEDYTQIIEKLRKKYTETLNNTVDSVYSASSDVSGNMAELQGQFDMYGVETMAKRYFDIIA